MGHFAFDLAPDLTPPQRDAIVQGWLAGSYDSIPVHTQRKIEGSTLLCERTENESAFFCVSWPHPDGPRIVSTATLRQPHRHYSATVELARGAVNRVRQFVGILSSAGFDFPAEFQQRLKENTRQFGRVALDQNAVPTASQVIDEATSLADQCAALLTNYRLNARHQAGPLGTRYGCRLSRPLPPDEQRLYQNAFNAVRLVPDWQAIEPVESQMNWAGLDALVEWAIQANLHISIGPLVDLSDGRFPQWLKEWQGDLPNIAAFMSDFAGNIVNRYKDRVRTWNVFAGFNQTDTFGLVEDDRLRLAARLLETVQDIDSGSIRLFSIAQPWGEYLTNDELTYSPFVFADTLLRVGYQLQGVELELIPETPTARGGHRHDLLDAIHQFELFDNLALPLEVVLCSGTETLLPTAVAVPSARAVYWDSWSAADPCSRAPASALVDLTGQPLPALAEVAQFRADWLR